VNGQLDPLKRRLGSHHSRCKRYKEEKNLASSQNRNTTSCRPARSRLDLANGQFLKCFPIRILRHETSRKITEKIANNYNRSIMDEHSACYLWSPKIKLIISNFINLRTIRYLRHPYVQISRVPAIDLQKEKLYSLNEKGNENIC
jgi:hypothetical protein